jgi:hypothetical protein
MINDVEKAAYTNDQHLSLRNAPFDRELRLSTGNSCKTLTLLNLNEIYSDLIGLINQKKLVNVVVFLSYCHTLLPQI